MNLLRKIKINKITPITFTEEESLIINHIKHYLEGLGVYILPEYYGNDNNRKTFIYYTFGNSEIPIIKPNDKKYIIVSKYHFYKMRLDGKFDDENTIDLIRYFFLLNYEKTEPRISTLAVNYVDNFFKDIRVGIIIDL